MRNRRHVNRRGPLVVYNKDQGITRAFRNIPGVELVQVERLNLLQLAPGGHLGRFIVWTESAFKRLDAIWGTDRRRSSFKKGYQLPKNMVTNSDIKLYYKKCTKYTQNKRDSCEDIVRHTRK